VVRAAADARVKIASWYQDVRMLRTETPELPEAEPLRSPLLARILRRPRLALPAAAAAGLVLLALLIRLGGSSEEMTGPVKAEESLPPVSAVKPATLQPAQVAFVAHPWAEIQVDDLPPFLTPRAEPVELSPGRHELVFRHPRYGEVRQSLVIQPGERRMVRHIFKRPAVQ
jgi:hypothetical protein